MLDIVSRRRVSEHRAIEFITDQLTLFDVHGDDAQGLIGSLDHGFCKSIYFAGPENLSLELSFSEAAINADAWIDPEVVALAGISAAELERYKQSSDFEDQGGTVPQPGADAPGPHMSNYPPGRYEQALAVPDDVMLASSENEPPVKVS